MNFLATTFEGNSPLTLARKTLERKFPSQGVARKFPWIPPVYDNFLARIFPSKGVPRKFPCNPLGGKFPSNPCKKISFEPRPPPCTKISWQNFSQVGA